jgi:hypothetical protein
VRQPKGIKDSTYTLRRLPKNEEIGGLFVLSGSELLISFQKFKIKIKKIIVVDVLSEAYSMIPLPCTLMQI